MSLVISVVLPAYNEEKVVLKQINEIRRVLDNFGFPYEIVVVNDGSSDKTPELVENERKVVLISHETNKGLGAALQTGFKNASGDVIVTMDCDLTHPVKLIPWMYLMLDNYGYRVLIASRYVNGGGMENVPLSRILISRIANMFFMLKTHVRDSTSGFRAYKGYLIKEYLETLEKDNKEISPGFNSQLDILYALSNDERLVERNLRKYYLREIPFILKMRSIGKSKFNFLKVSRGYLDLFRRILCKTR